MALEFDLIAQAMPALLEGLKMTGKLLAAGFPLGLLLGTCAAYATQSRIGIVRKAALSYVELVRNIPFLILVYLGFFGLPKLGVGISAFTVGIGAISFYTGGYFCEIMRAGFRSVAKGQTAAAQSLGMSALQTQCCIVLPQLGPFIAPATTSLAIQMLKDSAVFSVMSLAELTFQSQLVTADTFAYVEIFGVTALLYWCASVALDATGQLLEHYLSRWKRL